MMAHIDPAALINMLGAVLPVAAAVVASHFKLSNKITRVETELWAYKKKVDELEVKSEKHHDELFREVSEIGKSIQALEKTILETSLRRENDYARLRELISSINVVIKSQDERIFRIEQTIINEGTSKSVRNPRRKDDKN